MNSTRCRSRVLTILAFLGLSSCIGPAPSAELDSALTWPAQSMTTRPWAYWWWLGSAVDPENLQRELQRYQDAGMGGVHVVPIYGAKGYEARYLEYLSPAWMEMLACAVTEGQRRGLGVDMTIGTGWCFGGPTVPPDQATQRAQFKVYEPGPGQGLPPLDRTGLLALAARDSGGRQVDLMPHIRADGNVDWRAEGEGWKVYALSARPTGQKVKRAAPGGEGFMLNPFYGTAIRNYLIRFTDAFADYQGPRPRSMYHDSFEYQVDWSPDLLAEFEKRRGYRLQDELPALFGQADADRVARVKHDYRETVSDLLVENFTPTWVAWCRERGILTRNQAHGSPGNLLDLYSQADIPETEMFSHDREILVSKFASSAAHVSGRQLVASETGTWLAEHFTETLGDVKQLVDELFSAGVNHVVYHGCCYSPDDAPWPGWLFYASTEMNPRNSIWRDAPALNAYISRCQSILQAGRPDNDILLYWPIHDLWHSAGGMTQNLTVHKREWLVKQPLGDVARRLWDGGYGFDYVSDRQLVSAQTKDARVAVPGGSYRAIVVPNCAHIPLETVQRLFELAETGATVIFHGWLRQDVPGLAKLDQRRAALHQCLSRAAFSATPDGSLQRARIGSGQILVGDLYAALAAGGVQRESLVDDAGLLFIRRATEWGRDYFLANHSGQPLDRWVALTAQADAVALLDPMSGRIGLGACRPGEGGGIQVYVQLQPGESVIVRTLPKSVSGSKWVYHRVAGEPVELAGTWNVRFLQGGPELPTEFQTPKLASWADREDAASQRFAGTALYTLAFDAPAAGERSILDLGKVCQSARVRVNGRDCGTLVAPPFRVLVDGLRPQGNVLEVEVTNVSANRIRDLDRRKVPWKIFHDINFVNIDYRPFDAADWPLYDSGLLGPVTLTKTEALTP
jgi:hypothetical protein